MELPSRFPVLIISPKPTISSTLCAHVYKRDKNHDIFYERLTLIVILRIYYAASERKAKCSITRNYLLPVKHFDISPKKKKYSMFGSVYTA